jgi:hypothetical protein
MPEVLQAVLGDLVERERLTYDNRLGFQPPR